jgi:hypothetical protein
VTLQNAVLFPLLSESALNLWLPFQYNKVQYTQPTTELIFKPGRDLIGSARGRLHVLESKSRRTAWFPRYRSLYMGSTTARLMHLDSASGMGCSMLTQEESRFSLSSLLLSPFPRISQAWHSTVNGVGTK